MTSIYLVRVCQRADKSLFLQRKPQATTQDDYIAISHVWGTPETIQETFVDGMTGTVSLSPGKKDILSILHRPDVCGDNWLWMDLFCIDQSENASISITDQLMAIPIIYRSSKCVKVLIENPVCQDWQTSARRVYDHGVVDQDAFAEEELAHGRKCPHFVFTDPWFERLWTRQEGLYALTMEFILLNPVPCARHSRVSERSAWQAHGTLLSQRTKSETFFLDKLAYHGYSQTDAQGALFSIYCDVIYKHRVNMVAYNCEAGPANNYNPIREAWHSERVTSKARDYVLAVFPDVKGYRVPAGARKWTLPDLLNNAMNQSTVQAHFRFLPKVPRGTMLSSGKSTTPWFVDSPANIGEAYDTFAALVEENAAALDGADKISTVVSSVTMEDVDGFPDSLDVLKRDLARTCDVLKHMAFASPTGPCTGTVRGNIDRDEGLLRQYFAHQFAPIAVAEFLPPPQREALEFRTSGVISFERVHNIPNPVFAHELKRFLVCLICGTSLKTSDLILKSAEVVRVLTPHGPLLAVVHAATRRQAKGRQFALACSPTWFVHGFWVALRLESGVSVIGRTIIPSSSFWDALAAQDGSDCISKEPTRQEKTSRTSEAEEGSRVNVFSIAAGVTISIIFTLSVISIFRQRRVSL